MSNNVITKAMFDEYKKEQQILQDKFRKEQQNRFRRFVVFMIIFCLILSGITGVASYTLVAGDTSYTPKDVNWNVENVEAAVDDLHLRTKELTANYSTDETLVGRWIDGKKIYQKTIVIDNPVYGTSWVDIPFSSYNINSVEHVYYIEGIIYGGPNDPGDYNIYSYRPTYSLGVVVSAHPKNNKLMYMNNWVSQSPNGGKLFITMRYTKTSD